METKTLLLTLNERFHTTLIGMLSNLADEQIHASAPAIDERTITGVAIHAYSNVLGMFAVVAGAEWSLKQWPISDWPEHLTRPTTTTALLSLLDELHTQANAMLSSLSASALDQTVTLPWGEQPGGEAIVDALVHGFHHAGAIGGIRAIAGFPTPPDN